MKKTLKIAVLLCLTMAAMLMMVSCDELLIKLQVEVETTASDDGKSEATTPDESKPDESKPDESKPDESKPDESTPDESKPDESKPDESKPDESTPEDGTTDEGNHNEPHVHTIEMIPAVEPTCTEEGQTEGQYCSACGESLVESEKIAPTGHSYGEWRIIDYPSAIAEGCQVRECKCGEFEWKVGEALKHSEGLAFETDVAFGYDGYVTYAFIVGIGSCTDTDIVIPPCTPDGVPIEGIADYAFQDCTSITSINISGVMSIGKYAFQGCTSLTSAVISYGVQVISQYAFQGCTSLTSVALLHSVGCIQNYAFQGCTSLANFWIPEAHPCYQSINGDLYSADGTTLIQYAIGKSDESFTVPESVTNIEAGAFMNCTALKNIVIGDNVTSIGNEAFSGCSNLEGVAIPDGVTSIGRNAFMGCSGLTSIIVGDGNPVYYSGDGNCLIEKATNKLIQGSNNSVIPDSVTKIGDYAFYNCSALTSIVIPDSVTHIGYQVFYGCNSLESITIPFVGSGNGNYMFGSIFGAKTYGENEQYVPASLKTVVITGGDFITEKAFYNCSRIKSISIPESITYIGRWAFDGCYGLREEESGFIYVDKWVINGGSGLLRENTVGIAPYAFYNYCFTNITIPDSVKIICDHAFDGCWISSITIPDSVTSIGYYAFQNSSLRSITISDAVKSIGNYAFSDCSNLEIIVYDGTVEQWNTIDFGYSWNRNVPATEVICSDGVVSLS